jgi:RNA ligase (TIGR02306 family)
MENIATIQRVKNVKHHPGADALDLIQVLGWQIVTKRDEFKENDLCVYIVIDSVVPEKPEFEFLRNKNFRIKPIRLRGEESAGIVFPLHILTNFGYDMRGPIAEGTDVTKWIGVEHYEKPIPTALAGQARGGLPGFLIMTDELNLRTYPDAVPEMYGRPYYITRKDDGSSGSYFIKGGEFGVCSRKINLIENEGNGFWKMARKYDVKNALLKSFPDTDITIQGEVVGPGVQDNKLGLKELELHIFNLFDIVKRTYLGYDTLVQFCKDANIPMVTTIIEGSAFGFTLEELITLSNEQKYPNGAVAEGIVIRPKEAFTSTVLKHAWSGKVLNEKFKEKH